MLRLKLSKLKQVLASYILPRLFVRDPKFIKETFHNRTPEQLSKVRKSTNSGSNDEEINKKMRIIEKCFGGKVSDMETKDCKLNAEDKQKENIFPPDFYRMSRCDKCEAVISKLFDNKSNVGISDNTEETDLESAKVQATTSRLEEEKLAQKIEIIDETPHVEAHPPKVEGFNTIPKVLGHETLAYEMKNDQNISEADQLNLDEVAKRCLGSPIGKIDQILVEELKNSSQKDAQPKVDLDFLRNQCVEKHIITNTSGSELDNFQIIKSKDEVVDFGCRLDRIRPTHLDVLPLLNVNEEVNDFKQHGFVRDLSAIYLTKEVDESMKDRRGNTLSPYEQPAVPFYEYINKENIKPEEDSKIEAAATETIQDTEIIFNDEQFEREGIRQERSSLETPEIADPLDPKPNVTQFAEEPTESYIPKIQDFYSINAQRLYTSTAQLTTGWYPDEELENEGIRQERTSLVSPEILDPLNAKDNLTQFETEESKETSCIPKIQDFFTINAQRLYTSTSKFTSGWFPEDTSQKGTGGEQPSSAISATLEPSGQDHHSVDIPENTAISANQNPGEYYSFSIPEEIVTLSQSEPLQRLFADNPVTQNVVFSALPQLIETEEVSDINDQKVNTQEPISNILSEPESKQEMINEATTTTNLEKTACSQEPVTQLENNIPLSVVLKRIREENRLEYCRDLYSKVEVNFDQAKKYACPSLDKDKSSKSSEKKGACETKTKPAEPCKPKPCCPIKKNPCAKFFPIFLATIIRNDVPLKFFMKSNGIPVETFIPLAFINEDIIKRIHKLGRKLRFLKEEVDTKKQVVTARNFDPWIPIPSWPMPKKDKARTLVCPKDGCKVPVPKGNAPCKEKQCLGMPKKTFSLSQVFTYI